MADFRTIDVSSQIQFYYNLKELKKNYLVDALRKALTSLDIKQIDLELCNFVGSTWLKQLAMHGLRGEVIFPVPCILKTNPRLLGYYRLLYGVSRKDFYNRFGYGRFMALEERGIIPKKLELEIDNLCFALISAGKVIVDSLDTISIDIIHELQILTIGSQLRGGRNTQIGQDATGNVFGYMKELLKDYTLEITPNMIIIKNNIERKIVIRFSNDPDISITAHFETEIIPLIAIEIKGGRDISNIHNRIGEAEKSHQKAKSEGYSQFWTIIRVDMGYDKLQEESPTTTRFYNLDHIQQEGHQGHQTFKNALSSTLSVII